MSLDHCRSSLIRRWRCCSTSKTTWSRSSRL